MAGVSDGVDGEELDGDEDISKRTSRLVPPAKGREDEIAVPGKWFNFFFFFGGGVFGCGALE